MRVLECKILYTRRMTFHPYFYRAHSISAHYHTRFRRLTFIALERFVSRFAWVHFTRIITLANNLPQPAAITNLTSFYSSRFAHVALLSLSLFLSSYLSVSLWDFSFSIYTSLASLISHSVINHETMVNTLETSLAPTLQLVSKFHRQWTSIRLPILHRADS